MTKTQIARAVLGSLALVGGAALFFDHRYACICVRNSGTEPLTAQWHVADETLDLGEVLPAHRQCRPVYIEREGTAELFVDGAPVKRAYVDLGVGVTLAVGSGKVAQESRGARPSFMCVW